MIPLLVMAAFFAADPALETARDLQDRAALEKLVDESAAAAGKAPNDAEAQFRRRRGGLLSGRSCAGIEGQETGRRRGRARHQAGRARRGFEA